ncbi:DUF3263 domain-containing protein [Arcanobacterium canis]
MAKQNSLPDDERGLSEEEIAILDFEKGWRKIARSKDAAIRHTFQLAPFEYYLRLADLLDDPRAYAREPVLVARLKELTWKKLAERDNGSHR